MSISNTRLNRRAQLMRTQAEKWRHNVTRIWQFTFAFLPVRNNLSTQLGDGCEHPMKTYQIESWSRH